MPTPANPPRRAAPATPPAAVPAPSPTEQQLRAELEQLKQMNAELVDANTTLSMRYWIDQLKQLRDQVERAERRERERDSKTRQLENRVEQAADKFKRLQAETTKAIDQVAQLTQGAKK